MQKQIFTKNVTENKATGKEKSGLQTDIRDLYYFCPDLISEFKISGKGKLRIMDAYASLAADLKIC